MSDNKKKKVAFWSCGHLGERGTDVAMYDYAHYNEKILGNESFIFYARDRFSNNDGAIKKFYDRFQDNVYCIDSFSDMDDILLEHDIPFLYNLKHGQLNDELSKVAKNCVHCVFQSHEPHGEVYASIAPWVHGNENGYHPVVPHMVSLPPIPANINLRTELNIPQTATVFGGYGGRDRFDIEFVHDAVIQVAKQNPNIFFLFANFEKFYHHEENEPLPNIIHLPCIIDLDKKVEFINTCDAMLWARSDGEVFSMAMGEFSTLNKPIICKNIGYAGHVHLLKDRAIWYEEKDDLIDILENFDKDEMAKKDWNAYREYTPEKVMKIFDEVFLDGGNKETHSPSKRKIIDTFVFYNELTMLQFRLKELNDHVDYFVLVEAKKTFAGNSKPLFYAENIDRFYAYKDKIIHIVVDDLPVSAKEVIDAAADSSDPSPAWKNEYHQRREGIRRGLEKLKPNDEDIILVSDIDEIPKVETLDALRQNGLPSKDGVCRLMQEMYYYNLKCKHEIDWCFAKAVEYGTFNNKYNLDSQRIRMLSDCAAIENAGWHFSYFGNVQFIKNKIKNFSHQEYNNENILNDDRIYDSIEKGTDLFNRDQDSPSWLLRNDIFKLIKIEDNENLPNNYEMLL
jgi:energy-converting hydrogenase A subunit M